MLKFLKMMVVEDAITMAEVLAEVSAEAVQAENVQAAVVVKAVSAEEAKEDMAEEVLEVEVLAEEAKAEAITEAIEVLLETKDLRRRIFHLVRVHRDVKEDSLNVRRDQAAKVLKVSVHAHQDAQKVLATAQNHAVQEKDSLVK